MTHEVSSIEEVKVGASQDAGVVAKYAYGTVTGDPGYVDMIHNVCEAVEHGQNQALRMNWQIGDSVQSYIDAQGSKSVAANLKEIAQNVQKASAGRLSELGADALRKALNLRRKFTEEQLELAMAGGISFRNLLPLCKNDVSTEERDLILKDVNDGTLDQKKISDKVIENHPPEQKTEKRGGARKKVEDPLVFMKRIQGDMDKLLTDLKTNFPQYTAEALGSEDQATRELYSTLFEANASQIERLKKQWLINKKLTEAFLEE